jgi:hypothetical protein
MIINQRKFNKKRGFESVGWYCDKCKFFETDEAINRNKEMEERRNKIDTIKRLGLRPDVSDEEYNAAVNKETEYLIRKLRAGLRRTQSW